jgi:stage V sporulation protein R
MTIHDRIDAKRTAASLGEPVTQAGRLAKRLGLTPYPVNYWIVDYDEMNELIAYGGFQQRYPHWRWGMAYDKQQKQSQFLGGKAFEIVNNDNPAHAFLQESNDRADQKAVITHVEAHADFFANNEWFDLFGSRERTGETAPDEPVQTPDASAMLARHSETIEEYMQDPSIDRGAVERWIDHILCLEDTIDQHQAYAPVGEDGDGFVDPEYADLADKVTNLSVSDEVKEQVFDQEWLEDQQPEDSTLTFPESPAKDVLAFLRKHGKQYDPDAGKAVEMTEWQEEILQILRREAYYFAPQKMTKVMNEGWAAYWESMMMGEEGFATDNEFILYADHQSMVLGSSGLNPYKLGKELWEYIENRENRREVIERLLRVEDITWRNFQERVDFADVQAQISPASWVRQIPAHLDAIPANDHRVDADALAAARDGEIDIERYPWKVLTYEGLAERHYSLSKRQHRGFLAQISQDALERISRYMFDTDRYNSVADALADVEYTRGWDRMREIRESHNDVTFLDAFLSQEFVDQNDYFAYEYTHSTGQFQVSSTDVADVKKKLMLQFTNFGKPTILVEDGNYENKNELLLSHQYNGVVLDLDQAKATLKRVFELWGRPVNLLTIDAEFDEHEVEVARRRDREPEAEEVGKRIRYDGDDLSVMQVDWEEVEHLAASGIDYDTKPDDWLAD